MNEIEKVYYQDIREKKITATGAKHLASRGKRSFTVHNQSDHLSKKELMKMSGEVVSYPLGAVLYNEFKLWTPPEKKAYLEYLIDTKNASAQKIADMLGCHQITVRRACEDLEVKLKGNHMSEKQLAEWENFLKSIKPKAPESVENTEPIAAEPTETSESAENTTPSIDTYQSMFSLIDSLSLQGGDKDALIDDFRRALMFVIPDGKTYQINIEAK